MRWKSHVRSRCAETDQAAMEAVEDVSDASPAAGMNPGSAIPTFCRFGAESLTVHARQATNGTAEGVNTCIELLERMAYGFRSRANYTARFLLFCSGHRAVLWPTCPRGP